MAGNNPSAVMTLSGLVRSVERFDTKPDTKTGEVREAARVTILSEPDGGFCEVYVDPDNLAAIPAEDAESKQVAWAVTVRAGTRSFERQDGTTASFPNLWVRFVSAVETTGSRRLAPAV